jgi:hypothetical protein
MIAEHVERVYGADGSHGDLLCICGNMANTDGFFPCDEHGNQMSPDIGSDWNNLYVCGKCGRIIDHDTLEVVGQNPQSDVLAPAAV